jgi:hypothetical protein
MCSTPYTGISGLYLYRVRFSPTQNCPLNPKGTLPITVALPLPSLSMPLARISIVQLCINIHIEVSFHLNQRSSEYGFASTPPGQIRLLPPVVIWVTLH